MFGGIDKYILGVLSIHANNASASIYLLNREGDYQNEYRHKERLTLSAKWHSFLADDKKLAIEKTSYPICCFQKRSF